MCKVSIIIPVYNMQDKIKECMDSIIKQTYKNIEIIIVDDGSTDNSFDICKAIEKKDKRIKVIHTVNQGAGEARNCGIRNATGEYAYFPDADDYLEKNAIELLVDEMKKSAADLIVFGYKCINDAGEIIRIKEYDRDVIDGSVIRNNYYEYYADTGKRTIQGAPWNKFFSLNLIKENQIFFPKLKRHQDEVFIARYMNFVKSVNFVPYVLYEYYVNNLDRVWDKFPVSYNDIIEELYSERQNSILTWNIEDAATRNLVYKEYTYNKIRVLELSFSPKYGFSPSARYDWIKNVILTSQKEIIFAANGLHRYQRLAVNLIKTNRYRFLYCLLSIKVYYDSHIR